jgi:hypothetical protein
MSPKPKQDDPAQSKRFIETAREIGADESGEALERTFHKIALPRRQHEKSKQTKGRKHPT